MGRNQFGKESDVAATCFLGSNHLHQFCTDRGAAASVMFEIVRQGFAQIRLAET
jgi:hypothetical protein